MRSVQLISYQYPNLVGVRVEKKVYRYRATEFIARRAMVMMRFGDGFKGLNYLKKNGEVI